MHILNSALFRYERRDDVMSRLFKDPMIVAAVATLPAAAIGFSSVIEFKSFVVPVLAAVLWAFVVSCAASSYLPALLLKPIRWAGILNFAPIKLSALERPAS